MQSATQVSCFLVLFCLCFDGGFIEKATEFSVKDGLFFFFWSSFLDKCYFPFFLYEKKRIRKIKGLYGLTDQKCKKLRLNVLLNQEESLTDQTLSVTARLQDM